MSQTAENIDNSNVPTIQTAEEIQAFFKENSLLTRACNETELEYKAAKRGLDGPVRKMSLMHTIVLSQWIELWQAAEAERMALSTVVQGIVEK